MSSRCGHHFPLILIRPHLYLSYRIQVGLRANFLQDTTKTLEYGLHSQYSSKTTMALQSDNLTLSLCAFQDKGNELISCCRVIFDVVMMCE